MPRKKQHGEQQHGTAAPDTANPRPDAAPGQPPGRPSEKLPERPGDVTMPEAIPPRKDRKQP
jgi:hypothetical protein